MHDFASFMDSIGLDPNWDFLDFLDIEPVLQQSDVDANQYGEAERARLGPRENVPGSAPTAAEVNAVADSAGSEQALTPIRWKLTKEQWQTLSDKVAMSQELLGRFKLPSRPALSRYLQAYMDKFHEYYPMIHLSTYCPASSPLWLTLAIAAVGAQCKFEAKNGTPLFEAATTLTVEQTRPRPSEQQRQESDDYRTAMIQTLILLMVYGAWDVRTELLEGALNWQTTLSSYIRSSLRDHHPAVDDKSLQWRDWIRVETHRRTIQIAYAYLVIQSMTYDLPPVVLSSDIQALQLPCGSALWEAHNEKEWSSILHRSTRTPVRVMDAMRGLLDASTEELDTSLHFSNTASFIILQALIQRIYLTRQLHSTSSPSLPQSELESLQSALIRWKLLHPPSSPSSSSQKVGEQPVPFTSAAFLALAFARLHIDIGPHRQLQTRDPRKVAAALLSTPVPQCIPEAVPALLHAAHALSVPVLMGVDSVLGSQALGWSCEHSLCGLETGVFLWRWLESAGERLTWGDLDSNEKGIVSWVLFSIEETLQSVPAEDLGLREDTVLTELSFPKLGILVLKIWARVFSSNASWAITNEIGRGLELLAGAVETASSSSSS